MSCKRAAKAHVLNGVSLVVPILAILIALVVPIRITADGRLSAEPPVEPTSQVASPSLFLPAVAYDSGGYDVASVAVADVNKDGKPDVIVANACGSSSNCKYSVFGFEGMVAALLGNDDRTPVDQRWLSPVTRRVSAPRGTHTLSRWGEYPD